MCDGPLLRRVHRCANQVHPGRTVATMGAVDYAAPCLSTKPIRDWTGCLFRAVTRKIAYGELCVSFPTRRHQLRLHCHDARIMNSMDRRRFLMVASSGTAFVLAGCGTKTAARVDATDPAIANRE